jgi:arylsulfatase A-like enzyme
VPSIVSSQARVGSVASVIDIPPTILDLLGLPAQTDFQGESLLIDRPRVAFFLADYSLGWLGLRDGCWKYQLDVTAGRSTLFDVCRDPAETRDRSAEWPERIRVYRERVQSWSSSQRRLLLSASHVSADGHADDRDDQ